GLFLCAAVLPVQGTLGSSAIAVQRARPWAGDNVEPGGHIAVGATCLAEASARDREAAVLCASDCSLRVTAATVGSLMAEMFGRRLGNGWNGNHSEGKCKSFHDDLSFLRVIAYRHESHDR